jgi:hypothetical protein
MLDRLAPELIEHIAAFLDPKDLLSIRLACRYLCSTTSKPFCKAWFQSFTSPLSPQSLDRLEEISRNEVLRDAVKKIVIGPTRKTAYNVPLGHGIRWPREPGGQLDLEKSTREIDILYDILSQRLVNCTSFQITDGCGDFPERDSTSTSLSPSDAAAIFFWLIAKSGIRVSSFSIHQTRQCSTLNTNELNSRLYTSPAFQASWASLQDLDLRWDSSDLDSLHASVELISLATSLQSLAISMNSYPSSANASGEMLFGKLSEKDPLPEIRYLYLYRIGGVGERTLSRVLCHIGRNLSSLTFFHINLFPGTWDSVFANLATGFPHLKSIEVVRCFEGRGMHVFFCALAHSPTIRPGASFQLITRHHRGQNRVFGVRFRGQGQCMQSALKAMRGSAYCVHSTGRGLPDPDPAMQAHAHRDFSFNR